MDAAQLDAGFTVEVASWRLLTRAVLVEFAEVHTFGELQACDLARVVLNFEVGLEQGDVDLFAFHGIRALGAGAVEGEVTIVRFHKFSDRVVHGNADSQARTC
jgi:hypothetical protein